MFVSLYVRLAKWERSSEYYTHVNSCVTNIVMFNYPCQILVVTYKFTGLHHGHPYKWISLNDTFDKIH